MITVAITRAQWLRVAASFLIKPRDERDQLAAHLDTLDDDYAHGLADALRLATVITARSIAQTWN